MQKAVQAALSAIQQRQEIRLKIVIMAEKPDSKPDNKPGNADTIHPQSGQSSNAVETGDSTNVVLWITVFVIAAGMLVGGFICMKRRKNK